MNRISRARSSVGFGRYFSFGGAEQHVQEIAGVAQIVVGIYERHSQAVPVGKRRQRRHLADQAIGLLAARFGVENVLRVGIKSGKRGDGRNQHAHRMRVVVKAVEKFLDALVNERVVRDVVGPVRKLRLSWEVRREESGRRFRDRCSFPPALRSNSRGSAEFPCRRRCR